MHSFKTHTRRTQKGRCAAGLSEDTIGTILSRDLAKIKALLEREVPGGGFIVFMIIVNPNT
jgi:hypothetical protein